MALGPAGRSRVVETEFPCFLHDLTPAAGAEHAVETGIADRVYLSYQTVRNRVSLLLEMTGAANRTQLALMMCSRCPSCPDVACPANPAALLSPAGRDAGGDRHP